MPPETPDQFREYFDKLIKKLEEAPKINPANTANLVRLNGFLEQHGWQIFDCSPKNLIVKYECGDKHFILFVNSAENIEIDIAAKDAKILQKLLKKWEFNVTVDAEIAKGGAVTRLVISSSSPTATLEIKAITQQTAREVLPEQSVEKPPGPIDREDEADGFGGWTF